MSTDINTLNLADNGDGMVPLNQNPTTSFVNNNPQMPPPNREAFSHSEKNVSQSKEMTMDSTPINDLMMEPPMIGEEPKMQSMQMAAPNPQGAYAAPQQQAAPESKAAPCVDPPGVDSGFAETTPGGPQGGTSSTNSGFAEIVPECPGTPPGEPPC